MYTKALGEEDITMGFFPLKLAKRVKDGLFAAITAIVAFLILVGLIADARGAFSTQTKYLSYQGQNYTASLDTHGDLHITQNVSIQLKKRDSGQVWRQMYQQFTLEDTAVSSIEGISVKDLDTGREYVQVEPGEVRTDYVSVGEWNEKAAHTWYIGYADSYSGDSYDPDTESIAPLDRAYAGLETTAAQTKTVEIGWNIPVINEGTRNFQIKMTLKNIGGKFIQHDASHDAGAAFVWEPVSDTNSVPIRNFSLDVYLPQQVTKSWAWLHINGGGGNTQRISATHYRFTKSQIDTRTYVDFISVYQGEGSAEGVRRTYTQDSVKDFRNRENDNEQKARARDRQKLMRPVFLFLAAIVVLAALAVWMLMGAQRTLRLSKYTSTVDYYREIPEASPAAAAYIYAISSGDIKKKDAKKIDVRALNATIMALIAQRVLLVLPGTATDYTEFNLESITTDKMITLVSQMTAAGVFTKDRDHQRTQNTFFVLPCDVKAESTFAKAHNLTKSERAVLDVLLYASQKMSTRVFSSRDLTKFATKAARSDARHNPFAKKARHMYEQLKNDYTSMRVSRTPMLERQIPLALGTIYSLLLAWFLVKSPWWAGYLILAVIMAGIVAFVWSYGVNEVFIERNHDKIDHVVGFAEYLRDFSDFTHRGIADVQLWDHYLVYATAFGMSKEVADQLRKTYLNNLRSLAAQANQESESDTGVTYAYDSGLTWMWKPVHMRDSSVFDGDTLDSASVSADSIFNADFSSFSGFMDSFNRSLSSVGTSIQTVSTWTPPDSSGGSFSGGGFSGGGGGGGGGSFGGR